MKVMFIGLGLIGGSMALALRGDSSLQVTAVEPDLYSRSEALRVGAVNAAWPSADAAPLAEQDLILLCLHPNAAVDFISTYGGQLSPNTVLTDVCGVKVPIFQALDSLPTYQFSFIGGHPMAGLESGGFSNATPYLFRGAHYILVPHPSTTDSARTILTHMALQIGCCDVIESTPELHDHCIAYTSQLMHILALALCDQPLFSQSAGYEGGSFRGATRVAALDPNLWCELFDLNRISLADQIDALSEQLQKYSSLLRSGSREELLQQLTESSEHKKNIDRQKGQGRPRSPLYT